MLLVPEVPLVPEVLAVDEVPLVAEVPLVELVADVPLDPLPDVLVELAAGELVELRFAAEWVLPHAANPRAAASSAATVNLLMSLRSAACAAAGVGTGARQH